LFPFVSDLAGVPTVPNAPSQKYIMFRRAQVDLKAEIPDLLNIGDYVTSQAYILETKPEEDMIQITADTPQGAFYAVQTLLSILFLPEAGDSTVVVASAIPKLKIVDAPRYRYRGLHIGK